MKKKIKDLTLEEVKIHCVRQKEMNGLHKMCDFCSLSPTCRVTYDQMDLEREVEIDESNND